MSPKLVVLLVAATTSMGARADRCAPRGLAECLRAAQRDCPPDEAKTECVESARELAAECRRSFPTCEDGSPNLCCPLCIDPKSDARNCGGCGNACTGGKICRAAACACPDGLTDCAGSCRNLASDAQSCGACGTICSGGKQCTGGTCVCPAWANDCGGTCRNLLNDPEDCGRCANACAAGVACQGGRCATLPGAPGPTPPSAGPSGLPLDLLWDATDVNGLPVNPTWRARANPALVTTTPSGSYVDVYRACPLRCRFKPSCPQPTSYGGSNDPCKDACTDWFSNDWQACSTQRVSYDESWLCAGHVNWLPATWRGTIQFHDKSAAITDDDDYNWELTPPGGAGLVGRTTLHCEHDSDETIDHFGSKWWRLFHHYVDDETDTARSIVDGKLAVMTGLMGFDTKHGVHAEVHPIYLLAVRTSDDPNNETWVIFARNWGNQGGCGTSQHYLELQRVSLELPHPGATAVRELSSQFLATSSDSQVSEVHLVDGGAVVDFYLGRPEAQNLIDGELHLQWATAPAKAPAPPLPPPARFQRGRDRGEERHPGFSLLTAAQRVQLLRALPPEPARRPATFTPRRVPYSPPSRAVDPRRLVRSVPDYEKRRRDAFINQTVCRMLAADPRRPRQCAGVK